jgi:predicted XRE-type DNA-binding protein
MTKGYNMRMKKRTKQEIIKLLKENDYSQTKVAKILGVTKQRVHTMLKDFGIKIKQTKYILN